MSPRGQNSTNEKLTASWRCWSNSHGDVRWKRLRVRVVVENCSLFRKFIARFAATTRTYKLHGELPSSSLAVRYTAAWNLIGGRTPSRGHGPLENQPEFSATKFTRCIRARCTISSLLCVASSCKSGPLGLWTLFISTNVAAVSHFSLLRRSVFGH